MNTNPNQGHRASMQDYSGNYDNSTPYGGDSGRSASTGHIPYQTFYPQSSFYPGFHPRPSSNQFPGQLGAWQQPSFDFPQQYQRPQTAAPNGVDPGELAEYSRPANEDPWTVAGVGSFSGPRLQPTSQLLPPLVFQHGPHTAPAVSLSPITERTPLHDSRTSISGSQESGYASQNIGGRGKYQSHGDVQEFKADARANISLIAPPSTKSVKSESRVQTTEETKRRQKVKIQIPPCDECGKPVKNPSDARKHRLTHDRPYVCEVPGCSRSAPREGFSTKNDLQRHRKSVHKAVPSLGNKLGYICQACPSPGPGSSPKWWPRLDNFTAHVNRKHKDVDGAHLIKISEAPRPENAVSESGYASHAPSVMTEDQRYQHDLNSPMDASIPRQGSYQDSMTFSGPEYGHFDPLAGVGAGQVGDPFIGARGPTQRPQGSTSGSISHGLNMLGNAAFLASPVDSLLASPGTHRTSGPNVPITNVTYTPLSPSFNPVDWSIPPAKRHKPNWMETSKQQPSSSSSATVPDINNRSSNSNNNSNSSDGLSANRTTDGDYACDQCTTRWKRECDLRKHLKRHSRPYGCTFPNCYKRFGSRNDWKRHENSQHFLQEMWRCGVESASSTSTAGGGAREGAGGGAGDEKVLCGKLIYQEESFITHLQRRHNIAPQSQTSREFRRTMHLGREGHHHFWCGFCNSLVAQDSPDGPAAKDVEIKPSAWAQRLKHIGDHFDKGHLDKGSEHINDWVCIEHNKKKGLITREDRKKARGRLRGYGFGAGRGKEESADLPEDGIPDVGGGRGDEAEGEADAEGDSDRGW